MGLSGNRFSFKKSSRLLKPSEFQFVFNHVDCKQGGKHCTMLTSTNSHPDSRLGLIVAKRHIPLSVERNRVKRIARESFRQLIPDFKQLEVPFDTILLIKASAATLDSTQLTKELNQQWLKLIKKRLLLAQSESCKP